jgi:DNA-binding MarR family transcriptional regulator
MPAGKASHRAEPRRENGVWHPDIESDPAPRFSAQRHVGTALRETFRCFADALSHNLGSLGLSLNTWFVLRALWENDGLSQVELARRLDVTPAAMVGLVNTLQAAGLVTRERSDSDGRAFCIRLTQAGRDLRATGTASALQVDARALRGISLREIELMLDLMARLRRNLNETA